MKHMQIGLGWAVIAVVGCGGGPAPVDSGRDPTGRDASIRDASVPRDASPNHDGSSDRDGSFARDAARVDASAPAEDSGASLHPPDEVGPYAVDSTTSEIAGASVVAFVPALPAGARAPLVVLKHGFQLATANYAVLCERVASHGFVVIGVDTPGGIFGGPTNVEERDATVAAIDFALADAPFTARVDADRIAVLGHSRGGKVAVMTAAGDARIDAVLLLDPVNGCGPGAGYSTSCPDVTSAALAGSLDVPVGVMGETNNASGGFMPCAPADQNYQTIYDALISSPWSVEWTFTGADHMDFTDDGGGSFGGFCSDGPGDDAQIRDAVRAMAVAFARVHLRGESALSTWLSGPSLPAGIERAGP